MNKRHLVAMTIIATFWGPLFVGSTVAQEKSPIDVVRLFSETYGGPRMDEIADYTTAAFRENKPKSV